MKKYLQIFAVFFAITIFGQNISDYRYVMIPGMFKDAKTNRYDLNDLLSLKLKQKKYSVLFENQESWPKAAVENSCNVLTAELLDPSNMFRNKILIKFFDCKGKEISALEGKSPIKDFEPGMRDALENAAKNIALSNPVEQKNSLQTGTANNIIPESVEIITSKKAEETVASITKAENLEPKNTDVYSNGTLTLNKISVANGEFILANPTNYVPYAVFKPSSKKDTYRVQLSDGSATIGYLEEGKIVIELPNSDGSFRKVIFGKK